MSEHAPVSDQPMLRIPRSAHPVPTPARRVSRRVPLLAYVGGIVLLIAASIMGAQALGWYESGAKVNAAGERIAPTTGASTADIKGWMTIQQVLDAYPVTKAALYARFDIPADTPTSIGLGELKETGTGSMEIPELRAWIDEGAPAG